MKVSKTRMKIALQVRDTACRIVRQIGTDTTIIDSRGDWHPTREAKIGGLLILWSPRGNEQLIDIWQGQKVFSISWSDSGPYVVAFRPGSWMSLILSVDKYGMKHALNTFRCLH